MQPVLAALFVTKIETGREPDETFTPNSIFPAKAASRESFRALWEYTGVYKSIYEIDLAGNHAFVCETGRKVFFNLSGPSGAPSSSTEKGNTRKRMSVPSQVDSGSNPGTKGPAALGESHDLSEPTA